jgi:hypothetical protein
MGYYPSEIFKEFYSIFIGERMEMLEEEILQRIIEKAKERKDLGKKLLKPTKRAQELAWQLHQLLDLAVSKRDPKVLDKWGKIVPKRVE